MSRNIWLILGGVLVVAAFGFQFQQINKLERNLAGLRSSLSAASESPRAAGPTDSPSNSIEIARLATRFEQLERTVANLTKVAARVMPMNIPLQVPEEDLARMQDQIFDASASDADRLKALRTLRRNDKLNDDAITHTLGLLHSITNSNLRRELLQTLDGMTNEVIKQPLLALLQGGNDPADSGLRDQAVNMLRRFIDDPAVESKMWDLALNEPNTRVRDQARESIARAPATPERVEQHLSKAANPDASLEERLISFRALRLAKSHTPEIVADLANFAQSTTDPIARAKLFKSFNGLTDPSLMLPLVNGVQDPDPVVRQNAANALSSFSDPRVQQWLTHLIQNDTDPTVKREAHAALEHSQRLSRPTQ